MLDQTTGLNHLADHVLSLYRRLQLPLIRGQLEFQVLNFVVLLRHRRQLFLLKDSELLELGLVTPPLAANFKQMCGVTRLGGDGSGRLDHLEDLGVNRNVQVLPLS